MQRFKVKAIFLLCLISLLSQAQEEESNEEINRFRISADVGFPSLAGLNGEFVLPFLSNRIAVTADYSFLPNLIPNSVTNIRYFSVGPNIYLNKIGRGLYVGLGYGNLSFKTSELEDKPVDLSVSFTTLNSKIGLHLGEKYFFKLEVGYSLLFYDIQEANIYLSENYGVRINPTIDYLQLMNGKLGFGVSF